jgi:hypothetical protein
VSPLQRFGTDHVEKPSPVLLLSPSVDTTRSTEWDHPSRGCFRLWLECTAASRCDSDTAYLQTIYYLHVKVPGR